ncbi:hypothetical protein PUNSTDRAFT_54154, partial [Punctularia strigosozonata HHB-11173 SS5]|uniref:uncharacterized protein n=1 Tax=Punctularia strigosozonata (strain HHB-11173) TaxID=741275 RepID=UPI00044177B8
MRRHDAHSGEGSDFGDHSGWDTHVFQVVFELYVDSPVRFQDARGFGTALDATDDPCQSQAVFVMSAVARYDELLLQTSIKL